MSFDIYTVYSYIYLEHETIEIIDKYCYHNNAFRYKCYKINNITKQYLFENLNSDYLNFKHITLYKRKYKSAFEVKTNVYTKMFCIDIDYDVSIDDLSKNELFEYIFLITKSKSGVHAFVKLSDYVTHDTISLFRNFISNKIKHHESYITINQLVTPPGFKDVDKLYKNDIIYFNSKSKNITLF